MSVNAAIFICSYISALITILLLNIFDILLCGTKYVKYSCLFVNIHNNIILTNIKIGIIMKLPNDTYGDCKRILYSDVSFWKYKDKKKLFNELLSYSR